MEKSFMLIFSVIILCFAFCTFVFAEDTDFCTEHKLTYTQVEPTCTDAGFLYAKCENCSYEEKTNFVPAAGHVLASKTVTPPSCTEEGYTTGRCVVCGETVITDFVPALGHTFSENIIPPGCTEQGYTQYICNVCGCSEIGNYTAPTGHNYGEMITVTPAGCESEGMGIFRCTECGEETSVTVSATGHNYFQKIIEATCTEDGYTIYTCKNCGDSYNDDFVLAVGHSVNDGEYKEATCTADGFIKGRYCEKCGKVFEAEKIIPAKGHTEITDISVEATCTEAGLTAGKHCSVCQKVFVKQEKIAPKGHTYKSVTVEPTCTEYGYTTHVCVRCGDALNDEFTKPKGHSFGINNKYCSICGVENPGYKESETEPNDLTEDNSEENSETESSTSAVAASTTAPIEITEDVTDCPETSECSTSIPDISRPVETSFDNMDIPTSQIILPEITAVTQKAVNPAKINGEWINKKQKKTSIKKLKKGKKYFKIYWKKVSGTTGYQIQYSTDKKFKKNKKTVTLKKSKTTSFTIKKLKSKKKYYVRIRTYKLSKINGKKVKVYSLWSKAKSVTVK